MAQDLIMLTLIGGILEVFATKYATIVFNGTPFMCVSLLIVFIAVVRWNLWGLTIIPLMVLTSLLGGMWSEGPKYALVYDWHMYLATVIGLAFIGFNVIFFKKFGTKKIVSSPLLLIIMILIDYAVICLVQFLVYRLACAGTLAQSGEIIFTYQHKNDAGLIETVNENLCKYGENVYVYNLFSLVVTIVGIFILRSQGIVCNVKQRFIDDKKNAELDETFNRFSISEAGDEVSGEAESKKKIEESKDENLDNLNS